MPVRYVSFDVTVTCRVDANEGASGNMIVSEVSGLCIADFSLAKNMKDVLEHLEELAAETALANGEWQ